MNADTFASRVKAELDARGWGAYDLARAADMAPQVADRLVKGERQPSLESAAKIAAALKVSLDVLAGIKGQRRKR